MNTRPVTFRKRNVFAVSKKGYPGCFWPEHPTANKAGIVYVHRVIAWETYGDAALCAQVHHKNGDPWDWRKSNLELHTLSSHATLHAAQRGHTRTEKPCASCGTLFMVSATRLKRSLTGSVYCSNSCRSKAQERAEWPAYDSLRDRVDMLGYEAVGRDLGVTGAAVKKRLIRHGTEALN